MESLVENTIETPIHRLILEVICLFVKCLNAIAMAAIYSFKDRPESSVKDDIVLITGAGHGIGKELAKSYASAGATVVCWDINKQTNDETVKEIIKQGYTKVYGYVCDVSNVENIEAVARKVQDEVGCVTILINNAGIAYVKSILGGNSSEVERTIRVNTLSHFWTTAAFLTGMQRQGRGHIVAICSIAGLCGSRNGTSYCASKFAIRGMMESLYQELRANLNNKINVTIIYPSGVNTGIFKKASARFPSFLPIISPQEAASLIMKAQGQSLSEFSIPGYFLAAHNLVRLLPVKAQDLLIDFLDTYVIE